MQMMMVVVLIFSGYHLFNFFSKSTTDIVARQNNENFCGTVSLEEMPTNSVNGADGKLLFNNNCSPCHKLDKEMVGPALNDAIERWPDKELLYSWIRDSQGLIKSGNEYANHLYDKWNKIAMPSFQNLTDDEITYILRYLRQYKPQQISAPYTASL